MRTYKNPYNITIASLLKIIKGEALVGNEYTNWDVMVSFILNSPKEDLVENIKLAWDFYGKDFTCLSMKEFSITMYDMWKNIKARTLF